MKNQFKCIKNGFPEDWPAGFPYGKVWYGMHNGRQEDLPAGFPYGKVWYGVARYATARLERATRAELSLTLVLCSSPTVDRRPRVVAAPLHRPRRGEVRWALALSGSAVRGSVIKGLAVQGSRDERYGASHSLLRREEGHFRTSTSIPTPRPRRRRHPRAGRRRGTFIRPRRFGVGCGRGLGRPRI